MTHDELVHSLLTIELDMAETIQSLDVLVAKVENTAAQVEALGERLAYVEAAVEAAMRALDNRFESLYDAVEHIRKGAS